MHGEGTGQPFRHVRSERPARPPRTLNQASDGVNAAGVHSGDIAQRGADPDICADQFSQRKVTCRQQSVAVKEWLRSLTLGRKPRYTFEAFSPLSMSTDEGRN
jgi:hypothetical protein